MRAASAVQSELPRALQATPKNGQQAAGRRQADDPARQAQREDGRLAAAQADVAADIHRLEEKLRELHRQAALLAEQRRALASTPQVRGRGISSATKGRLCSHQLKSTPAP